MTLPNFNLNDLRLSQDFSNQVGVKKLLNTVHVRDKPDRHEWVRVHPDQTWRIATAILEFKEDREKFLVAPALHAELFGELVAMVLFTAITRQGVCFLWSVRLPSPDGRQDDWNRSKLEAAQHAMKRWVRVASNRPLGAYEVFEATGVLPEPEWPEEGFEHIFRVAFKDHFIESVEHPAIRRLRGEV
jgi:hypothetical protein